MKLSTETIDDLLLCIDARLEEIHTSKQSQFIKDSQMTDVMLMCTSLGLHDKAKEIESDLRVEEEQDNHDQVQEDKDADVEWNNRNIFFRP